MILDHSVPRKDMSCPQRSLFAMTRSTSPTPVGATRVGVPRPMAWPSSRRSCACSRCCWRRVEAILRPLGLTFARYEVLMLLRFSRKGCLPVGKIGERLQVHPASVTNAVQRLEAAGFVTRSANPVDGRSVLAEITQTRHEADGEGNSTAQRPGLLNRSDPASEQREVYSRAEGHAARLRRFPLNYRQCFDFQINCSDAHQP